MSERIKIAELEREQQERARSILRMRLMERDQRAIDALPALLRLARAAKGVEQFGCTEGACVDCDTLHQALDAFDFEDEP